MSDIDHAIYYLRNVVGLHHDADAVESQRRELITLRAELDRLRGKGEPVVWQYRLATGTQWHTVTEGLVGIVDEFNAANPDLPKFITRALYTHPAPQDDARDAAISHIAAIAHDGGLRNLDSFAALVGVRKLSLPYWNNKRTSAEAMQLVDAATLAAKGGKS